MKFDELWFKIDNYWTTKPKINDLCKLIAHDPRRYKGLFGIPEYDADHSMVCKLHGTLTLSNNYLYTNSVVVFYFPLPLSREGFIAMNSNVHLPDHYSRQRYHLLMVRLQIHQLFGNMCASVDICSVM